MTLTTNEAVTLVQNVRSSGLPDFTSREAAELLDRLWRALEHGGGYWLSDRQVETIVTALATAVDES